MKIGERGQITIPKKLREKYGFFPNIEVEFNRFFNWSPCPDSF
jgi:AbrB family looped-hinge helix DNA binding protein